ncbi:cell division protein ZipA [Ferrimonas sp. YFM]|uniref:cell division protein ZipA n=1 Tax=Ferrimonas sp. YFM TaxID=3028878 RepID=UPI0025723CD6|nr:cell division protein ZipA [Ferrimonas sp. YFM]BDY04721.1 cell division protein ZipA [Ferrimonas sp. YFM]
MDDFRIILIVVGLLSIVGLLAHGLWSIRRQQPRKMKARPLQPLDNDASRDSQGFDPDGVGQVRTISTKEPELELPKEPMMSTEPALSAEPEPKMFAEPTPEKEEPAQRQEPALSSEPEPKEPEIQEPTLSEAPLAEVKPLEEPQAPKAEKVEPQLKPEPKAVDPLLSPEEVVAPEPQEPEGGLVTSPEDVLVMHVVAKEGESLQGAELLHNFLTLGMKFGEMNIFHRHQDSAGRGPVMYSLANMMNPGTFDPDTMEQFETQGVSLFMTLPNQCDETVGFSMMMGAAQALADMHGAIVLNDSHKEWDDFSKDRYMARIQKFENQPI